MHPTAERIQQVLHDLGVETQVVEFTESTRTSADAAAAIGTTVGQICKSIVFAVDGSPLMVMASGVNRIDTTKVEQTIGKLLGKANAAFVRDKTGFAIGGVPPVGHLERFPIFVDRDLLQYDIIYAAAGTPNTIFPISSADLVRVTGATVLDCRVDG
ncbi:MAG: YbaK/EbsC family protein [Herpetosiphonaceae bacterium]|nr:YbaK/EbsC family protein [Herpetosiphonaceae bacterium]